MTCFASTFPLLVQAMRSAGLTSFAQLTRAPMRVNGRWQAGIK